MRTGNSVPVDILQSAQNKERFTVWVVGYETTLATMFGFMCVERAKHRAFSAPSRFRMIDGVDQQGETQDIRKKNEFLKDGH